MGRRTSYTPGTFSWVDLATTDTSAAKSFYAGLFGWEMHDEDAGGGSAYAICTVDGDAVCAIFEMSDDMRARGLPSQWTSYVTVADADAIVSRVNDLGGAVIRPAFDALDAGRAAVLEDPQGAAFAVWQPRTRIGAERVNDVGCLCMNELATTDLDAAAAFYDALFGWTTEPVDTGPVGPAMASVYNAGNLNATYSAEEAAPSHWRAYFTVESTETAVARVRELGGHVVLEPVPIPDGSIALALDPQGALMGLFEGEVDP